MEDEELRGVLAGVPESHDDEALFLDVVEDLVVLDHVLSVFPLQSEIADRPHPGHLSQQIYRLE